MEDSKVLCFGTFDGLHPGHIKYLSSASEFGSVHVLLTGEKSHTGKKPERSYEFRKEIVSALEMVNEVYRAASTKDKLRNQMSIMDPDVVYLGYDYKDYKDEFDCDVKICGKYKDYSSSNFS